jgi:hypothetical protein
LGFDVDAQYSLGQNMKDYTREKIANGVTVSTCAFCSHKLASRAKRILRYAEKAHSCPEKEAAKVKLTE